MAVFYDISLWQEQKFIGTGGTRNKAVFQNPDDNALYYFKTSLKKEDKDYKYEFWSEIIASEIGRLLGFNVLVYDIAFNGSELGCISKLMTSHRNETLIEGYKYLTAYNPKYTYENKRGYTFQFIREALKHHKLDESIEDIIKIIVFDSLIGNSDRHQENWGFIQKFTINTVRPQKLKFRSKREEEKVEITIDMNHEFSPIYDSGSCLGREIADDKIGQYLTDTVMTAAYVGNKGKSEIHWNGEKLSHLELLHNVMSEHRETVLDIIYQVQQNFASDKIEQIVMHVDDNLPKILNDKKIPLERKKLIIKFVTLRYERLISMIK
jgi:hypothetical protein